MRIVIVEQRCGFSTLEFRPETDEDQAVLQKLDDGRLLAQSNQLQGKITKASASLFEDAFARIGPRLSK